MLSLIFDNLLVFKWFYISHSNMFQIKQAIPFNVAWLCELGAPIFGSLSISSLNGNGTRSFPFDQPILYTVTL